MTTIKWVSQLNQTTKESIRKELIKKFKPFYLYSDLLRVVDETMECKIVDLNEFIDMSKYIENGVK